MSFDSTSYAPELRAAFVKKVGANRGIPRIWLEGQQAARAGFSPGDKYAVEIAGKTVVLKACDDGTRTVSAKRKGDKETPIIDLNSNELLSAFEGMEAVRVVVRKGEIILIPLASELKKQERIERIRGKMARQEPLSMASLSHGGGVLSHAIHTGLARAGVPVSTAFVNEIREDLIEHAAEANPVIEATTQLLAMPMQEVAQDDRLLAHLPRIDILEAGIPCSGASVAGRAKRGLDMAEAHPEVGHLVYSALAIMNKVQPAVVLIENVPAYANSASAYILRWQLRDMGYDTHEAILSGKDFGCLEHRERWCMVATTKGLDFSFEAIAPTVTVVKRLGEILERVPDDDPRWSEMRGLKDKQERDIAAGKGFRMQVFDADSPKIATVTKGYAKVRSTDPKIAHPTNPDLLRQLTPVEHARVKQVPETLIEGLSNTLAHELLGQGIVYEPFAAVGRRIGETLQKAADGQAQKESAAPVKKSSRSFGVG